MKRCDLCNRPLKDLWSQEIGMGPICHAKHRFKLGLPPLPRPSRRPRTPTTRGQLALGVDPGTPDPNFSMALYRGFRLEAKREQALGGWDSLYYHAHHVESGYFLEDSFTTGDDSAQSYIEILKGMVDEALDVKGDCECGAPDYCHICQWQSAQKADKS